MEAKRNKLVIIGNGFDLAHEFKTSYNNFILWYLNDFTEIAFKNHSHDDEVMNAEGCRNTFEKKPEDREVKSIKDFQDNYINKQLINIKSDFFKRLISEDREYSWIDIEKDYYKTLIRYYNAFTQSPKYLSIKDLKILNKEFEFIRGKLEDYLTIQQRDFIQKLLPNFNSIFGEVFIKDYYHSFKEDNKKVLFLNFNYTNTIEAYINKKPVPHELIYIHGKLNEPKNPMIFGFGDEIDGYYKKIEELNENEFLNNFKSFGYFQTRNYQNFLSFVDSDLFDVEILGHSCGLSDRVLLNTIFEHDNCEAIKIHYYENDKGENDFTFKTQEISRHFNDKAKMRKRIVNLQDCQPLKV